MSPRQKRINIVRGTARPEELTIMEASAFGPRCVVLPILSTWRIALSADDLAALTAKLSESVTVRNPESGNVA